MSEIMTAVYAAFLTWLFFIAAIAAYDVGTDLLEVGYKIVTK